MSKSVFGLVSNLQQADHVITKLQAAGFSNQDISILLADQEGKLTTETGASLNKQKKGTMGITKGSKAGEAGATGAAAGGLIGGSIGLLAGVGSLAIPGLGVLIVGGPLVAALSGSAVGGALGLFIGTLVGLGIPEYEAKKFESEIKSGKALISVHVNNSKDIDKAKDIFEKNNVSDIAVSREKAGTR